MMRNIFLLFVTIVTVFSSFGELEYTYFTKDDLKYKAWKFFDDYRAYIIDCENEKQYQLVTPESVEYEGIKYNVIGLDSLASARDKMTCLITTPNIRYINIPNLNKLNTLVLGRGVTTIGTQTYLQEEWDIAGLQKVSSKAGPHKWYILPEIPPSFGKGDGTSEGYCSNYKYTYLPNFGNGIFVRAKSIYNYINDCPTNIGAYYLSCWRQFSKYLLPCPKSFVVLSKREVNLSQGETCKLNYWYMSDTGEFISNRIEKVIWISHAPSIASVNSKGEIYCKLEKGTIVTIQIIDIDGNVSEEHCWINGGGSEINSIRNSLNDK